MCMHAQNFLELCAHKVDFVNGLIVSIYHRMNLQFLAKVSKLSALAVFVMTVAFIADLNSCVLRLCAYKRSLTLLVWTWFSKIDLTRWGEVKRTDLAAHSTAS